MDYNKRNTIIITGTFYNNDESRCVANANQIYSENARKSIEERVTDVDTKVTSIQKTVDNISSTGTASAANSVTYANTDSGLAATNIQDAVDEVSKKAKTNADDIASTKKEAERLVNITWSELKALKERGALSPGRQYRITDYQCTTVQENTQSAGHQFDIIVTADSAGKLNEQARAIRHDKDEELSDAESTTTDGTTTKSAYFAGCKMEAWKIWYCLDNDTNRFAWADATNGKGTIYRMIDEFNNDCPYDFKNIQFKRYKIIKANQSDLAGTYLGVKENNAQGIEVDANDSLFFYTFSYLGILADLNSFDNNQNDIKDASIVGNTLFSDVNTPYGVYDNIIKSAIDSNSLNLVQDKKNSIIWVLNNIVFLTSFTQDYYYGCYSNSFGNNCYYNSFGNDCSSNSFGNGCYSNSFGDDCYSNSFGVGCSSNSFGNGCYSNSFGNDCSSNSFGNDCSSNSFGNDCYYNSFGNDCYYNTMGVGSAKNKLDAYYKYNKFENGVKYVEFSGVGTSSKYVQNYHIKQGMTFTSNNKHTITAKPGLKYETSVAKKSDGTVVEYCEADLLNAEQK